MVIQGICIVKTYDIDIGEHVKNRHFLLQQSIDIHGYHMLRDNSFIFFMAPRQQHCDAGNYWNDPLI